MANIHRMIARELGVREQQVAAAVALLDGGATVPFIARYRKELTGALDDAQLRGFDILFLDCAEEGNFLLDRLGRALGNAAQQRVFQPRAGPLEGDGQVGVWSPYMRPFARIDV